MLERVFRFDAGGLMIYRKLTETIEQGDREGGDN